MAERQKVLVIVGPTSSGKTALAVDLAKRFKGEVISADSRQVYRGLDIGTGKVTRREMRGIPHHLLDVAPPKRVYTAADYAKKARPVIRMIARKGKLPIIAGGTGFYIDTLLGRVSLADVPPNKKLRATLSKKTSLELYRLLQKRDPKRARSLSSQSERNNKVRLIRALEVAAAEVSPLQTAEVSPLQDILWIGLEWQRDELAKRIRTRLKARLKQGMLSEARRLHKDGLSYKRMEALGLEYRAMANFLQGKIERAEMEKQLARNIMHYAKRQATYWKRNSKIRWFAPKKRPAIATVVETWLKK